jgi:hypothetical protein
MLVLTICLQREKHICFTEKVIGDQIILLNLGKEIFPFVTKGEPAKELVVDDDCSDILVVNEPAKESNVLNFKF